MNKLLASLFAVAALSLANSAFALDAAKVTEPVKAADKIAAPAAKVETTKAAEPAKVEEVKAAEPAKTEAAAKPAKKHHRKHAKKTAEATPAAAPAADAK